MPEEFRNEKEVVNYLIHLLNSKGNYVWRNNSGIARAKYKGKTRMWRAGISGSSDILGIAKDGKFLAVECKYGYNKPSERQLMFLKEVEDRGGYAIVAYGPDDIPKELLGGD